jgi:hypothetical protein
MSHVSARVLHFVFRLLTNFFVALLMGSQFGLAIGALTFIALDYLGDLSGAATEGPWDRKL